MKVVQHHIAHIKGSVKKCTPITQRHLYKKIFAPKCHFCEREGSFIIQICNYLKVKAKTIEIKRW